MSKLTDKIEAVIAQQLNSTLAGQGGVDIDTLSGILADVCKLEQDRDEWQAEHGRLVDLLQARNAENKQAYDNGFRVASEQLWRESESINAARRAAKREAYETAQQVVAWTDGRAAIQAKLAAAIDALDTEGNSDE